MTTDYLDPLEEYLKPWRLYTLALGLLFLLAGAAWSGLPDWDVPVSLLMAALAYLTAAPSLRVVMERKWHQLPLAAFWTWFTVDGSYWVYWTFRDPAILEALRHANAPASLGLYIACGLAWYTPTSRGSESLNHND